MPASSFNRPAWLIAFGSCLLGVVSFIPIENAAQLPPLPPGVERVLGRISADSLRGNLSFLASDALKGRYTPSPELDVAAEFIAAQFRKAGLEPGGDRDYFQTARMVQRDFGQPGAITVHSGPKERTFPSAEISILSTNRAVSIKDAPVLFLAAQDPALLRTVDVEGHVIVSARSGPPGVAGEILEDPIRKRLEFARLLSAKRALALVSISRDMHHPSVLLFEDDANQPGVPTLGLFGEGAMEWLKQLESASRERASVQRMSFGLPAPRDQTVFLKNVIGILRGSDLALKDTAVVVSAHYDHIGTSETAGRLAMTPATAHDQIYNGANDDGSGTVSVIEIANALARLRPAPKRSIVFVTFFGEEVGEFGSRWFAAHSPFPIADTVAGVNLEQVGRTDSNQGPHVASVTVTGYDFSNIATYLKQAGKFTGIKLYKDEQSDAYFDRSDNTSLASKGVPAHTISTAFEYLDYHGVGDEWQKIDYQNMVKVDQAVALAVLNIANDIEPPHWNAGNEKTAGYRQAQHEARKPESTSTH